MPAVTFLEYHYDTPLKQRYPHGNYLAVFQHPGCMVSALGKTLYRFISTLLILPRQVLIFTLPNYSGDVLLLAISTKLAADLESSEMPFEVLRRHISEKICFGQDIPFPPRKPKSWDT